MVVDDTRLLSELKVDISLTSEELHAVRAAIDEGSDKQLFGTTRRISVDSTYFLVGLSEGE